MEKGGRACNYTFVSGTGGLAFLHVVQEESPDASSIP